jgi:hypothetical protein
MHSAARKQSDHGCVLCTPRQASHSFQTALFMVDNQYFGTRSLNVFLVFELHPSCRLGAKLLSVATKEDAESKRKYYKEKRDL